MACVLSLANSGGGKCGQKSWEIFMETMKGDTDLWDKKMEKNHPGINFYRLHMCTKKGRKRKGKFLLYIDLGCILLSAYTC